LNIQTIASIVAIIVAVVALRSDNKSTTEITNRLDEIGKVWKDNIEQEKKLGIPRFQLENVYLDGKLIKITLKNIGKRHAYTLNGYAGYLFKDGSHKFICPSSILLKGNTFGSETEQTLTGKITWFESLKGKDVNVLVKVPYVDMDFGDTLIFKQLILLKGDDSGFIKYSNDSIENYLEAIFEKKYNDN